MHDDLPAGTVTFLFTDVEGSTMLLQELGAEVYADALAEHRRIVREACTAEGGVEVDNQGDAFFLAFPTAPGALEAARAITQALDPGPIRLRIGLHTGSPLVTAEGYVGADVHRAARIAAAGHGGQVLVSASTASLLDIDLRDLGEYRLKDLSAPQRIYQLGYREHPKLRSLHLTNLPVPATPFLGRHRELAEVSALLTREDVRLLTLTGPGGTGKTRLAAQAAGLAADAFPDGVWWVPLASLRDPELVLPTAAQVLGAKDALASYIADRRLLVLFDNFEHVMEAASALSELLISCRNLKLLTTSREPLHLAGEQEYSVQPFAPEEGIAFFLARARAVKPAFEADEAVAEICRRLDELPLALELAAARVKALSPTQILERLGQRLPLLTGGARDTPERQRTLRATIEWSYDQLALEEQVLFRRSSVFAGGFTLDAAEGVVEADVDTLQSLVDKSLLRHSGERYLVLETIREYGRELLAHSDELPLFRDRHLSFFVALAVEAEPNLTGRDQRSWFERLALEQDNVRDALTYACDIGDRERALMLAGSIWRYWWTRGQIDEAAHWYERAFRAGGDMSEAARARGMFGMAHVSEARGDVERTRLEFEEAAELLRRIGEKRWLVLALTHLAWAYEQAVDRESAERLQLEALEIAEEAGDRRGAAIVKGNLAGLLIADGQVQPASRLLHEALEVHRALGDAYGTAACLATLGKLALRDGDFETAGAYLGQSLELSGSIGDTLSLSLTLPLASAVVLARGDAYAAARLCAADESLLKASGIALDVFEAELLEATMRSTQEALGDGFEDARAAGGELDAESAVELALEVLGDP
jgi:predicted ATPase/class 3 adenylate cyclase/Tfp pilus assembly protein PilF